MGDHAQADFVAKGHAAVAIEQVGMIVIDQFLDLGVPLPLPARIVAVPAGVAGLGREVVEVLVLRVGAVVGHAGLGPRLVGPVAGLEPGEAGAEVLGDAEPQAVLLGRLLPVADDVALGAHVHGVPLVQLGVPEEEVVVVRAHADEVLSPGFLVELHEAIGIPLLGLPQRDDVLVAELGRVAVMLEVILVVAAALLVDAAGVPVAIHRHGLRTPVGPDAELGVAEPVRALVLLERFHRGLEMSRGDGQLRGRWIVVCARYSGLNQQEKKSGGHERRSHGWTPRRKGTVVGQEVGGKLPVARKRYGNDQRGAQYRPARRAENSMRKRLLYAGVAEIAIRPKNKPMLRWDRRFDIRVEPDGRVGRRAMFGVRNWRTRKLGPPA